MPAMPEIHQNHARCADAAREALRTAQEETERLHQQALATVSGAVDASVMQPLKSGIQWVNDNSDLYEQCNGQQKQLVREAVQRICGTLGIAILPSYSAIHPAVGTRQQIRVQKEQTLEQWLYYTQKDVPFGHKQLEDHFSKTMNGGSPVQRSFYMKQVEGLIRSGFVKDLTQGSRPAKHIFQYVPVGNDDTTTNNSDWPITKPETKDGP